MAHKQSNAKGPHNPPRGSSMFSRGRNQSLANNDISSSGRDLFIFNINSNSTGKRKLPILEEVAAESEVEIPDSDSLERTKEDSIITEDAEKSSIFHQKQVQSMISFLLKPMGLRRGQEQAQLPLPDLEAAQYADSQPNLDSHQRDLKSPFSNKKGKARAIDADVAEQESLQEPNPRVHVISTQDHRFLSVAGLTRHNVSSETYAIHMLPYRHGYPLWLPQPDMSLPIEYREVGIDIGDVGIITPDGGFDFLFNIWLPSSHPVNPRNLPPDFDVLPRPERTTYREERLFNSFGNICCGAFNSNINHKACSLEFTCNKEEGSVLAFPDGASREDLKNENCLEDFIKQSAESWYRYATGPGDRLLEYNSLYIVTGCMKTQSWGIATYSSVVPPPHNVIVLSKSTPGTAEPYIWEKQGGTISRTGPYPDRDLDNTVSRQNQCMFIRGYKVALSEAAWLAVKTADNLPVVINSPDALSQVGNEPALRGSAPSPPSTNHNVGSSRWASNLPMHRATDVTQGTSASNVDILPMPVKSKIWHPLDALNDLLLERVPEARVALTHDSLWCDIVEKYGGAVLATTLDLLPFYTMKMYRPHLKNNGATFILGAEHEMEELQQGADPLVAFISPPILEFRNINPIDSVESLQKDAPPGRRSMKAWLQDARSLIRGQLNPPVDRTPQRKPQGHQELSLLPDVDSEEFPPSPIPSIASEVIWSNEGLGFRRSRSNYRLDDYSHEFIDRPYYASNMDRFKYYRSVAEKRFRNTGRTVKNAVIRRRRSLSA